MTRPPITRRTALATLAAPAIIGCTPKSQQPLRFWAMGREGEVVADLLRDFNSEHPHIQLQIEQLPWLSAHEKLLTAFAGDATPDIAQLGNTWVPELGTLDALFPLNDWVAAHNELDPPDWFPGIWRTNVVDGQLLGIPWYVDTRLLFYRRDLFDQAGITRPPIDWQQWTTALDALQSKAGIKHPQLLPLNEFEPLLALALQQPDPLLRDSDRYGNFRSAGFRHAADFFLNFYNRRYAPPVTNTQIANLWQEFGRGTFAAYISGPWNIGELDRRLGPERRKDWTTAPLPGPEGPGASTAGGASLVVFRRSRRRDDALKVLAYLARPATQARFHALTGNLPPRRSTWALPTADGRPLAEEPRARAFAQQLERAKPAPAVPEWERIAQEMQQLAQRAVHEDWTGARLGQALDARTDAFLEKRRWMLARRARRAGAART
jgi:multiple sugar transport system substrate-binding protein